MHAYESPRTGESHPNMVPVFRLTFENLDESLTIETEDSIFRNPGDAEESFKQQDDALPDDIWTNYNKASGDEPENANL